MHHLHINPSEIELWDFYEYQYTINNLVEHLKKEKEKHKEEEDKASDQYGGLSSQIKGAKSTGIKGSDKYLGSINRNAGLKSMGLKSPSIKVPKI